MNNNALKKRQYALLAFFMPFVFKFVMLPALLQEYAGRDSWVAILFITILEFLQLAIIVAVDNSGGIKAVKEKYGKFLLFAVTVPLIFVAGSKLVVLGMEVINYATSYLFYNITGEKVTIVLFIAIFYVGVKRAKVLGRLADVMLWMLPVIALVGIFFGKVDLNENYVMPIMAEGIGGVAKGLDKYIMWTFDLTPLLFFERDKSEPERVPSVVVASISSIVFITGLYILYIMNYGGGGVLINNAFSSLGSFNVVNTEIGSIDWPTITVWLSMAVITLSAKTSAVGRICEEVGVKYELATFVFCLITCVVSVTLAYNPERAIGYATSAVRYVVVGLDVLVPIVLYILLFFAKKNSVERVGVRLEKMG